MAQAQWLTARQAELLAVPYSRVVFTLPAPIAAIAFQNKAVVYAILFAASTEAMTTLAANPRRLGPDRRRRCSAHMGADADRIIHTCIASCQAAVSRPMGRWVAGRPNFFLAVKPLAKLFRRLFIERLQKAFETLKALGFYSAISRIWQRSLCVYAACLAAAQRVDWIVYSKKPFCSGPAQVLAYLGRYTHRVAIANSRIQDCDDDHVAFAWKDYRDGGCAVKTMCLKPDEFIRRFPLLHALPDGFHRISAATSGFLFRQWPPGTQKLASSVARS